MVLLLPQSTEMSFILLIGRFTSLITSYLLRSYYLTIVE